MKISIIIPVLNEVDTISDLLTHLIQNSTSYIQEILIVDGGSTDGTQEIIKDFNDTSSDPEIGLDTFTSDSYRKIKIQPDVILINSEKGRAKQMNIGTSKAQGDILYFLHADSFPPKNYDQLIINEVETGYLAGCFRMKFDSNHPVLKISQWFTRFNYKGCRGGDQSLFITKMFFENLNGYNESYIIYEDCEFINRIYSTTIFKVIPKTLTTSARRYEANGILKLQYHFMMIHLKKWLGASAESLLKYYLKNIVS